MADPIGASIDGGRLREVLDALREGVQILSPAWRYLYVNESAARHGRRPRDELLGRTLLDCYPGIETTRVFAEMDACMRGRRIGWLENEFTYPDGARAWFELRIEPCREGIVVLSLDVSERKGIEGVMLRTEKLRALGEMAAGVAHDLGNILNPLGLLVERLRRRLAGAPDDATIVAQMAGVLAAGTDIVGRLREFGRHESPPAPSTPVDLSALGREAVAIGRMRVEQRRVDVAIEEALSAPVAAPVSGSELLSAVVNLVVNAIDAVGDQGRIAVRTGRIDGQPWIEVEDDGAGMPPEVEARAFEPFFTTKGAGGTGLGLAMVYRFAARHGGRVDLRTAPGRGTTVRLVF